MGRKLARRDIPTTIAEAALITSTDLLSIAGGHSPFLPLLEKPGMNCIKSSALIKVVDGILSLPQLLVANRHTAQRIMNQIDITFRHTEVIHRTFAEDNNQKITEFQINYPSSTLPYLACPLP